MRKAHLEERVELAEEQILKIFKHLNNVIEITDEKFEQIEEELEKLREEVKKEIEKEEMPDNQQKPNKN